MKKRILFLSLGFMIALIGINFVSSASVNVTSVQNYSFSLPQNTTNWSYQPFKGGQTMNNSIPFATFAPNQTGNYSNDLFWQFMLDVYFNSTGIIVNRTWPYYSSINASVYVVQFGTASVIVKNGTFTLNGGTADFAYQQIPDVSNLANTALLFYYASTDTTDDYADNMVRGRFVNTTYINFSTNNTASSGIKIGRYYVFESLDGGFTVQSINLNIPATTTTLFNTTSSVNTSKTLLIASYESGENDDDARDGSLNVSMVNSTYLVARRFTGATGSVINATVFLVTFAGDEVVQNSTLTYASGTNSVYAQISPVNLSMTMVWNPVSSGTIASGSTTAAAISAYHLLNLTNSTYISGLRGNSTSFAAGGTWQVVQWVQPAPPGADSCTCTDGASWTIINGDQCVLSTTCNLGANRFRIMNGALRIASSGSLNAQGCYVQNTESLFVISGGKLICR